MMATLRRIVCASLTVATAVTASPLGPLAPRQSTTADVSSCPGYKASNIKTSGLSLTADLTLAGTACNVYGDDIKDLTLTVEYQTSKSGSRQRECGKCTSPNTNHLQMSVSTSRSRMQQTKSTRFPSLCCLARVKTTRSLPSSNSTTSRTHSASLSLVAATTRQSSIHLQPTLFSRASTSG